MNFNLSYNNHQNDFTQFKQAIKKLASLKQNEYHSNIKKPSQKRLSPIGIASVIGKDKDYFIFLNSIWNRFDPDNLNSVTSLFLSYLKSSCPKYSVVE